MNSNCFEKKKGMYVERKMPTGRVGWLAHISTSELDLPVEMAQAGSFPGQENKGHRDSQRTKKEVRRCGNSSQW